jgi:hypothetical protein
VYVVARQPDVRMKSQARVGDRSGESRFSK